jgi:hypothetical protein
MLVDENVATLLPNPEPKRREVPTFESVTELDAISEKLEARFKPIPVLVGLQAYGLRNGWRSNDATSTARRVSCTFAASTSDGQVKLCGKQEGSLRAVPLPAAAAQALDALPARLDTPLSSPVTREATATSTSGGTTSGLPPSRPQGSFTAVPTRSGTPMRRSPSQPVRTRPLHGYQRRANRPHLRAPATRLDR